MAGGYFVGLNAQPNLYSQIYANKQARVDADRAKKDQEAAEKYAKDADKFRIDYSKIHPYHAKEAKLAVAEFMSKANELQKQFPHTYSNTEEYNNAFFNTTSKLEDLTNSSKNIYGDFQRRADNPDDFETRPEVVDAINRGDHETITKLMGKDYFDAGDVTQPRFKIEEHADLLNKGLERPKVYNEAKKRNVGGASNDYIIPYKEAYDPAQFDQLTEVTYSADPIAKQKFKTIDEYRNTIKPLIELKSGEEVKSLQSIPAGTGSSAAIQQSLTNNGQGHSMDFGITDGTNVTNYRTQAAMRLSLVPTPTVISAGENTFNKEDGKRIVGGKPVNATIGEIAVVPVWKRGDDTRGKLLGGRVVSEADLKNPNQKGKYEYKVIYTGKDDKDKGIYGDISQVESSLFSKESPITDKTAFAKSLEDMKAEAAKLNKENGSSKQGSQQSKTLSSGRVVYSDDGGKTWHP